MNDALIEVRDLKKYFKTGAGMLHAVDGVNLRITAGQTLGVVGESGCGKSTLGRCILRLLEPTGGQVLFKGENILAYDRRQMHRLKQSMQLIFQDPYSSLDPRLNVRDLIAEPLKVSGAHMSRAAIYEKVDALMGTVGLDMRFANSYPHELDGGRRQRVGIARALALGPEFIVCDEPVSALDVSIQAQILNLMMDFQEEKGLTYLFITHDLSVVRYISHQIAVMYLGQCVELAETEELFREPLHPYTRGLLEAIPVPSLKSRMARQAVMRGELTSPIEPKPGCRFAPRCPYASEKCTGRDLPLKEVRPGHYAMCSLYE